MIERGVFMKLLTHDELHHLTLEDFILMLLDLEQDFMICGLGDLHSYRGNYAALEFEEIGEWRSVQDIMTQCADAIGTTFTRYKGGEYTADKRTLLYIGREGYSHGQKLVGLTAQGVPLIDD
jgi:hypothetical protein